MRVHIFLSVKQKGTVIRIFQFTEKNDISIDAHRPQIYKAGILRVVPHSPVGIGGVVTIEVEASSNDVNLSTKHCFTNFPKGKANEGTQLSGFLNLGRGLYTMDYHINEGDPDQLNGELPFQCTFIDGANNSMTFGPIILAKPFLVIDAHPPTVLSAFIHEPKHYKYPARMGTDITIGLVASEQNLNAGSCLIDNFNATKSFSRKRNIKLDPRGLNYYYSFTVAAGQGDWEARRLGKRSG